MKSHGTLLKTLSATLTVLVGAVVVGHLMTQRARAQGNDNPGNPAILAAVQDLQKAVVGLQSTVNTLQTSIDALSQPDQSKTRFTPILSVKSEAISCHVLNVSNTPRSVRVQLIRYLDDSSAFDFTISVPAGSVRSAGQAFTALTGYCKFTVVDGVRSDIRANIEVLDPGFSTSFLSVAAE